MRSAPGQYIPNLVECAGCAPAARARHGDGARASVASMDGHEVGQELPGVGDVVEAHAGLELGELVVGEVAVTGVEAEPVGEVVAVELGMELGGVEVVLDAEHLHGAGLAGPQDDGVGRQLGDGLLMGDEGLEDLRDACADRVGQAGLGEGDVGGGDGLTVGGVDNRALVAGERADAVAGAEEGEVGLDDAIEQRGELALDPILGVRLLLRRGGGVEGRATHEDAGPVVQVDLRQGPGLQAQSDERGLVQAGALEECLVLGVSGLVVAAGGQEEEGFHGMTLAGAGRRVSIVSHAVLRITFSYRPAGF